MSSDLEARLRRAEQLLAVLARQLGGLGPIGQTLGNVAQQLASSGGWGSTYTGGNPGVVQDTQCNVSLPSTLSATIFVEADSALGASSAVSVDLDWDGTEWSGCVQVDYPGPTYFRLVGGAWTFAGRDGTQAVAGTPVWITVTPVANSEGAVTSYQATIGQSIDTAITTTENEPYTVNGIGVSYGPTDFYCPVAGDCGEDPNYSVQRFVNPSCTPWSLFFSVVTPPSELDGPLVLPARGQNLSIAVATPP